MLKSSNLRRFDINSMTNFSLVNNLLFKNTIFLKNIFSIRILFALTEGILSYPTRSKLKRVKINARVQGKIVLFTHIFILSYSCYILLFRILHTLSIFSIINNIYSNNLSLRHMKDPDGILPRAKETRPFIVDFVRERTIEIFVQKMSFFTSPL